MALAFPNVAHALKLPLPADLSGTAGTLPAKPVPASVRRLRRFTRTRVYLPVVVFAGGAEAEAVIDNVSEVGVGLVCGLRLGHQEPLRLRLPSGDMLEGLVRWTGEGRCGAEITNATYVPGLGWQMAAPQTWTARLEAAFRVLVRRSRPLNPETARAPGALDEAQEADKRSSPHGLSPAMLERAYREEGAAVLLPFPVTAHRSLPQQPSPPRAPARPARKDRQKDDATHELRASVTLLKALVERALETPAMNDARAVSPLARAAVSRGFGDLLELVDRAFQASSGAFSQSRPGRAQFAPRVLVQDIAAAATAQSKGAISVRADIARDVPELVLGDVIAIRQILVALVTNALKFTDRGSVTISLGSRSPVPGEPASLSFEVADTGRGIAPERLSRVFERGRCYGSHAGKGLGLAIARELATRLGGSLTARSTVGVGSAFRLDLPLEAVRDQPALMEPSMARRLPAAGISVRRRVLVVDDVALMRSVPRALLEKGGHHVDEAADGHEALALLRRNTYDLVLLDSEMPGMSGVELVLRARFDSSLAPSTQFIVQTAGAMEPTRKRFEGVSILDVIRKPLNEDKLAALIASLPVTRSRTVQAVQQ